MTPWPRKKPQALTVVDLSELFLRAFDAGLACASARQGRIPSLLGESWKSLMQLAEGPQGLPSPPEIAMRERLAEAVVREFLEISALEWDDPSVGITALVDLQSLACVLAPWRFPPECVETPEFNPRCLP